MKSRKLPALQWYPGDWRKDVGVQSLTYHARGVWFEMLMLMHESERRGMLILNGRAMSDEELGRLLGLDNQTLNETLTILLGSGVAARDEQTGAFMCRRMVRDEEIRQVRSEAGKLGGNPVLVKQIRTTGAPRRGFAGLCEGPDGTQFDPGHRSIQVTVDIYGHLIPGANISFVDRLDAVTMPQPRATSGASRRA